MHIDPCQGYDRHACLLDKLANGVLPKSLTHSLDSSTSIEADGHKIPRLLHPLPLVFPGNDTQAVHLPEPVDPLSQVVVHSPEYIQPVWLAYVASTATVSRAPQINLSKDLGDLSPILLESAPVMAILPLPGPLYLVSRDPPLQSMKCHLVVMTYNPAQH